MKYPHIYEIDCVDWRELYQEAEVTYRCIECRSTIILRDHETGAILEPVDATSRQWIPRSHVLGERWECAVRAINSGNIIDSKVNDPNDGRIKESEDRIEKLLGDIGELLNQFVKETTK